MRVGLWVGLEVGTRLVACKMNHPPTSPRGSILEFKRPGLKLPSNGRTLPPLVCFQFNFSKSAAAAPTTSVASCPDLPESLKKVNIVFEKVFSVVFG